MKKMAPPPPPSGTTPATPLEIGTIEVTVNVIVRAEIGIYGVADHIGSITVGASAEIEIWRRERKMAYSTRPEGRPPVRRTPLSRTHTIKKQWACQRSGGSWL
jgi:hypothetical protein